MTETRYLIAHKVDGELAFDVAEQIQIGNEMGWIIPTSGHRAYPYWSYLLDDLYSHPEAGSLCIRELIGTDELPAALRDHYTTTASPRPSSVPSLKPTKASLDDLV